MIQLADEDTSAHLVAGRRAAYTAVLIAARDMGDIAEHSGDSDEEYAGGHIRINGLDIGPAVDAAVLETLVRCKAPSVALAGSKRREKPMRKAWNWFWYSHRLTQAPLLNTLIAATLIVSLIALWRAM